MNERSPALPKFMYVTPPRPCPYIIGRVERDVFVELTGDDADGLHMRLAQMGFRRSHNVAYRPDCPGCDACVSVRVLVDRFVARRTLRRVWRANDDITGHERPAIATDEQFALFQRYQASRHGNGEMATMAVADYRAMVEHTNVSSRMIEFRDPAGTLVAGCLADRMPDGYSAVYSVFEPELAARGLGNFMVLWLIEAARRLGLPHLYLGYWIRNSRKMAYKARFQPLQALGPNGWSELRL